jgi:hypothetical protein
MCFIAMKKLGSVKSLKLLELNRRKNATVSKGEQSTLEAKNGRRSPDGPNHHA